MSLDTVHQVEAYSEYIVDYSKVYVDKIIIKWRLTSKTLFI